MDSEAHRRALVRHLQRAGMIASAPVRDAFLAVPRERFLSAFAREAGLAAVYRDEAILTRRDPRGAPASSSSQPAIMALMLERLDLARGQRVLEVGTGTGYNAALLAEIVGADGSVVTVELDPETAAEARAALEGYPVEVVVGDGRAGRPETAPYDRLIATASAAGLPRAWHEQLVEGGIAVVPLRLGLSGVQAIPALRKEGDGFRSVSVLTGGFMPLRSSPDEEVVEPSGFDLPSGPQVSRLVGAELADPTVLVERPRLRRFESAPRWSVALYLALEAPPGSFVDGPAGPGVVAGNGLALVTRRGLAGWGDEAAEALLDSLLAGWRERGRPTERALELEVRFEDGKSRLSHRWA